MPFEFNGIAKEQKPDDTSLVPFVSATPPEQHAESQRLGAQIGMPPDVVRLDPKRAQETERRQKAQQALEALPSRLRADPNVLGVVQDKPEELHGVARVVNNIVAASRKAFAGYAAATADYATAELDYGAALSGQLDGASGGLQERLATVDAVRSLAARDIRTAEAAMQPGVTLADVWASPWYRKPDRFVAGGLETVLTSLPEMAVAIADPSALFLSRVGTMSDTRAQLQGKEFAGQGDLLTAAPFAGLRTVVERVGADKVFGVFTELAKTPLRRVLTAYAAEGGTEVADTVLENIGSRVGVTSLDVQEILQGAPEAFLFGGFAGATVTGGIEGVAALIGERQIDDAKERAEGLTELATFLKASEIASRSPEQTQKILDAQAPDTEVFFDAEAAATFNQDELPAEIVDRIDEAVAMNSSLRVTIGELVYFKDQLDKVTEHARVGDPRELSVAEAEVQAELYKSSAEKANKEAADQDAWEADVEQVRTQSRTMWESSGRFSKDVSNKYAELLTSFFTARAARKGTTPSKEAARFQLRVQRETVDENALEQTKNRLRVRHFSKSDKLTETDPAKFGTGGAGRERERATYEGFEPRTYFGTQAYRREASLGPYEYAADIDPETLYDASADPQGFGAQARKQVNEQGLFDERAISTLKEKLIRGAGFKGYQSGDAIAYFEKLSVRRVQPSNEAEALEGAPRVEGNTGPIPELVDVARAYALTNNIPFARQAYYAQVDAERAQRIAAAYEAMEHAPNDPKVREAYTDLIRQTHAQYDMLIAAGYKFDFFDGKTDPYAGNPHNAMRDLRHNKHMSVYGTYDGFGTSDFDPSANLLLVDTGLQWPDQNGVMHSVLANDLFRAVHDAFGHGLEGAGFRASGEENAWQAHAALFTGPALGALTTETRGQNSWLNYGPHGDKNRTAPLEDTTFADQKSGLMPEWTWTEGRVSGELQRKAVFNQSVPFRRGKWTVTDLGLPQTGNTVRRVAEALDRWVRSKYGKIPRRDFSKSARNKIAGALAEELMFEIEQQAKYPGRSGIGWYSERFPAALDKLGTVFPEFVTEGAATDLPGVQRLGSRENIRAFFTAIIAVTSDGQSVPQNMASAVNVWRHFRQNATLDPDKVSGPHPSIRKHIERLNSLLDAYGPEQIDAVLMQRVKVKDARREAQENGQLFTAEFPASFELPRSAGLLGSKVGIFYANLRGDDNVLTMDRWWTRTFSRLRGDIAPEIPKNAKAKLRAMLREAGETVPSDEVLLQRAYELSRDAANKRFKELTPLEFAGNRLNEAAKKTRDSPDSASQRAFMVEVTREAQRQIKERGVTLSLADIQAGMWYYEKRLYGQLGVRQSLDIAFDASEALGPVLGASNEPRTGSLFEQSDARESQLDTPGFKEWSGGLDVIEEDAVDSWTGGPAVFATFHGTTHPDIERVNTTLGSEGNFLGRGFYSTTSALDASENYAGIGNDLAMRISVRRDQIADEIADDFEAASQIMEDYIAADVGNATEAANILEISLDEVVGKEYLPRVYRKRLAENVYFMDAATRWQAEQELVRGGGFMMPLWVKMEKPLDLRRKNSAFLDYEFAYENPDDPDSDITGTTGDGAKLIDAMADILAEQGYARRVGEFRASFDPGGVRAAEIFRVIRQGGFFKELEFTPGDAMQEAARRVGFDGVVMNAGEHFPFMKGARSALHVVPFEAGNIKSAIGNDGTFDRTDDALLSQTGARGNISLPPDITKAPSVIALLETADLSTAIHEMGHFFYEVLATEATQPDAHPQDIADLKQLFDAIGFKGTPQEWLALPTDTRRQGHEQVARSFEAYIFEGKAPNTAMHELFQTLRSWLLRVYKAMQNLNVKLTDEVRGVFDRMLATEAQIAAAESQQKLMPLFEDAEAAGMTEREWEAYQKSQLKPTEDALEDLERRSLRDMRWLRNARSRELRKLQRENKDKRKAVEEEVTDAVDNRPEYIALQVRKTGRAWINDPELGGERVLTHVGTDVGVDELAEMLGLSSGDELIKRVASAPPRQELIDNMTDQVMMQRYGDLNNPERMQQAVEQALHTRSRERAVSTELAALQKATGGRGFPKALREAARAAAQNVVRRKKIRELRPQVYQAGATKAAAAATEAFRKNDIVEAAARKRDQLFNMTAGREATDLRERIQKGVKYLLKFNDAKTRAKIDPAYRDQIDRLLEKYNLRPITLKEADKRASLAAFVKAQEEAGHTVEIDDELLADARQVDYRNLTGEQFLGLLDAVKNIAHLAALKNKLLKNAKHREKEALVTSLVASIEANEQPKSTAGKVIGVRDRTLFGKTGEMLRAVGMSLRKLSSFARVADGLQDDGAFFNAFVRPMNDAASDEAGMLTAATKALTTLGEKHKVDLSPGAGNIYIPALRTSLALHERIAVYLNSGNEGNLDRLERGNQLDAQKRQAVIDTLKENEVNYAQELLDYIDSYWPQIAEKQQRVTGLPPEKVDAMPIVTRFGLKRGGYFPIVADPNRSARAAGQQLSQEGLDAARGAVMSATTRRGHTKARVGGSDAVLLDVGVAARHIRQLVHDLAWHETLLDINAIQRDVRVQESIRDRYGPEVITLLRGAIEDSAVGVRQSDAPLDRVFRHLRAGSTVTALGLSASTTLLQLSGLAQSMVRAGSGRVLKGVFAALRNPVKARELTLEKSAFMRTRDVARNRELSEFYNQLDGKNHTLSKIFFWPIQAMQSTVDIPTWIGAFNGALSDGKTEADAIAIADAVVRESQSAGFVHDLAKVQRGGEIQRTLTQFYSYFSATYQLAYESGVRLRRSQTKGEALANTINLATDYLLLFVVPAAFSMLVRDALRGDLGDDEPEDLATKLVAGTVDSVTAMFPGVKQVTSGRDVTLQGFQELGRAAGQAKRAIATSWEDGVLAGADELDASFWKSLNRAAGVVLHYPAAQAERTVTGIAAIAEGDAPPPAILLGPPRKQ